jgi:hypothetical protein
MSLHLILSNSDRLQQVEADVCKSELTIENVKTIHRFHKLAFDRGALGVSTELLITIGDFNSSSLLLYEVKKILFSFVY